MARKNTNALTRTAGLMVGLALMAAQPVMAQCGHKGTAKADFAYISNNFPEAIKLYQKAAGKVGKDKSMKACVAFMVAKCYLKMNEYRRATSQLKKVLRYDAKNAAAIYEYANLLKSEGEFEEAMTEFKKYKEMEPNDPRGELGFKSCELAIQWQNNPTCYQVENVKAWNTRDMEFSPFISSRRQDEIIFTSNRKFKGKGSGKEWGTHGGVPEDLYMVEAERRSNEWKEPKRLEGLSSEHSEGSGAMDNRYSYMYFTRCFQDKKNGSGCRILKTRRMGTKWAEPENIEIAPDSFVTAHPTISGDGKFMVFSSNMTGTKGGMDLWVAEYQRRAKTFVEPKNLGDEINTTDNEVYPHLKLDGTLYFSSNRPEGMGGLDIYKAELTGDKTWGKVENMMVPINSPKDDFGIMFERGQERGYLSSNREGSRGLDDIWAFSIPTATITLSGTVVDVNTREPLENATVELTNPEGEKKTIKTDKMGFYKMDIPFGVTYDMQATKESYYNDVNRASSMGLDPLKTCKDTNIVADFALKTTKVDLEFEIQFIYTRKEVEPEYMDTVKNLQLILEDNPRLKVEIGAHTDSRGSEASNLELANRRANEIVSMLVEAGIDPGRLVPKGYGESEPRKLAKDMKGLNTGYIFKKDTIMTEEYINALRTSEGSEVFEDAHRLNRRVTLKILSDDFKSGKPKNEDEEDGNEGTPKPEGE